MSETPGGWVPPTPPPPTAPGWGQPGAGPPPPGWGPSPPPGPGMPPPQWGHPGGWPPENKPGIVPLRPLGLGEILDGAFTLIRRYPRVTLGLSAVIASINGVLRLIVDLGFGDFPTFDPNGSDTNTGFGDTTAITFGAASLLTLLLTTILTFVLVGMLTVVAGEAILGRPITAGETWARIRPRFMGLIGVSFLATVLPYFGLIGLIVFGVFLWAKFALAVPAFVLERVGPIEALRRSWRLVRGSWWRVFGIRLLGTIIVSFISGILTVPFYVVAFASAGGFGSSDPSGSPVGFVLLTTLGQIIAETITTPLMAGILVLLYVDRRMRAEALDVALVAAAGGVPPTGAASQVASAPPGH